MSSSATAARLRESLNVPCVAQTDRMRWHRPLPAELLEVELLDVSAGLANLTEQEVTDPVIRLNVKIDQRGLLHAVNAVALGETKGDASLAGKLMGLFGGSKDKGDTDKADEDSKDKDLEKELQAELAKAKEKKVAIRFREIPLGVKPAALETRKQAKARYARGCRELLQRSDLGTAPDSLLSAGPSWTAATVKRLGTSWKASYTDCKGFWRVRTPPLCKFTVHQQSRKHCRLESSGLSHGSVTTPILPMLPP